MSTSKNHSIAEGFANVSQSVMLELTDRRGIGKAVPKDIESFEEREVLYPPKTTIQIKSVQKKGKIQYVKATII